MSTVNLLVTLKAVGWTIPLIVLLGNYRWRFLVGALIMLVVVNVATAVGISQESGLLLSVIFQALLIAHAFDLSRYSKPDRSAS